VELCRGVNATSLINLVNTEIITPMQSKPNYSFDILLYVKFGSTSNPQCSFASYSHTDNCNYLKEAVRAIGNLHWMPLIVSTATQWKQYFGNSCDTFATDTGAMLSYAVYDSTGHPTLTQSYDDFVPFGGFAKGNIWTKQVGGVTTVPLLCGPTAWHAYVI